MTYYSFIILTYNEEIHLGRLLNSIKELEAPVFVLDSGSTDDTLKIADEYGSIVKTNPFENHPKQWDYALNNFDIKTEWIIGLDADQYLSDELLFRLKNFSSEEIGKEINGIYFNRKNYFKGRWIKHGGYFPKYLLKMFRTGTGHSDLNENMDHRFIVKGKTVIWKDGYLIEENLKENNLSFWIDKHNRYSNLVAKEEIERRNKLRVQSVKPKLFGSPDEKIALYKKFWWSLPLFVRPFIYFFYRYFIRMGFLDGKEGFIFHYLQAFWFRFVVDAKIREMRKNSS
jgi:glycosyltransferase involved in cell wall biosynthesis